jgi:hypothetical protein
MGYASRSGRAQTSARNPRAFGVCDRCGIWTNHDRLSWQFDWRGASLMNTRILVCDVCLDVPQTQLRAIVVPADPTPIINPRVESFVQDETNYRSTSGQDTIDPMTGIPVPGTNIRVTSVPSGGLLLLEDSSGSILLENGVDFLVQEATGATATTNTRVTQQTGGTRADKSQQPGLDQNAVMPLQTINNKTTAYYVTLSLVSVTSDGAGNINVTCSTAHNLSTGNQISVEGLSKATANGFYTVTVTTATAFTYQVNPVLSSGSLLTGTTKMVTANAGLPYNNTQIPQTGPLS